MPEQPTLYGWYSEKAAEAYGTVFYLTPRETEVEVTLVTEDPAGETYWWDDKVALGEVVRFSRPGRIGTMEDIAL